MLYEVLHTMSVNCKHTEYVLTENMQKMFIIGIWKDEYF